MNVLDRDFFTDPEILDDPTPYYAALRERGRVVREPHRGVFMLSASTRSSRSTRIMHVFPRSWDRSAHW